MELNQIIEKSEKVRFIDKINFVKQKEIPPRVFKVLEISELEHITKLNNQITQCKNQIISLQKNILISKQPTSGLKSLSVELYQSSELLFNRPKAIAIFGGLAGLVAINSYFEAGKNIYSGSKGLYNSKKACLNKYSGEIALSEDLGFSPYFKNDEPF